MVTDIDGDLNVSGTVTATTLVGMIDKSYIMPGNNGDILTTSGGMVNWTNANSFLKTGNLFRYTNTNLSIGGGTRVRYNNQSFQSSNVTYNAGTGEFTIPAGETYEILASGTITDSIIDGIVLTARLNGSTIIQTYDVGLLSISLLVKRASFMLHNVVTGPNVFDVFASQSGLNGQLNAQRISFRRIG